LGVSNRPKFVYLLSLFALARAPLSSREVEVRGPRSTCHLLYNEIAANNKPVGCYMEYGDHTGTGTGTGGCLQGALP
jgi:hypothetical protein